MRRIFIKNYHRNEKCNERLQKLKPGDGSLWRLNKYLRTERHQITVIEDEEGSAVFRDRDIAEKIASAFESYHATPNTSDQTELQVQSALNNFFLQNPIFPVRSQQYITSSKVIKKLIKQSPFLKAPGKDGI